MYVEAPDRPARIGELARLLPRRNALLARLLAREAGNPLPRGMASLLGALDEEPRQITRLAEREGLAQPTVTRMVERLEALGLVTRERDAADGRAVVVRLTPAGAQELASLRTRYAAVLEE